MTQGTILILAGIATLFFSVEPSALCSMLLAFLAFVATIGFVLVRRAASQNDAASPRNYSFPCGIESFVANAKRFQANSFDETAVITGYGNVDAILEQMLNYIMRDYIDLWYDEITNDELFRQSLKRTSRRTVATFSQCVRKVDWVPFFTRHFVDDFASHMRLYRKACEKMQKDAASGNDSQNDLESHFFDLELEMEKHLCRDLLSTTPHYENAYLHDLIDVLLYLLMPPEDFRCRPLRFLLREVAVKLLFLPLLDHFSDPANMNQLLVWLLSDITPRPEDFVMAIENSTNESELQAVHKSVREEVVSLRGRDTGEQGDFVKQQLASLEFLETTIRKKLTYLSENGVRPQVMRPNSAGGTTIDGLIQLPIHVVLTNAVAVTYFCDFLTTVGGQHYIDCYLAIEGFKVSVEHQLRSLSMGETTEDDVYETVKIAANFLYQQYLSQEAITRVPLRDSVISKFRSRMKSEEPSDALFEQIQEEISDVLKNDERFYPMFMNDPLYEKMLLELGIISNDDDASEASTESSSEASSISKSEAVHVLAAPAESMPEILLTALVETLGIGHQGKQSFALYNIRVERSVSGKRVSGWNVLRRYSDFHTLHTLLCQTYPKLSSVSFPGKKTFNNLDPHFLERRTAALNTFLDVMLNPNTLAAYPGMVRILYDFLSQKEYAGNPTPMAKKVVSAMWDPIAQSVRAVTKTVAAMPDQVVESVSKVGDGIGRAAKAVIAAPGGTGLRAAPALETDRVAARISEEDTDENIPLRVMLLFVDEVFGVRARNAWFRRQLIALMRQIVTPLGTSINKRIVDLVNWLTSEQQVVLYLSSIRDTLWPDGKLAPETEPRAEAFNERSRVLSRVLMLGLLPDELRLILGQDTAYQGIDTISAALQRQNLNRRLLYVLLERLLVAIFPQNRFEKIFELLHGKSPRSKKI